jgi:hypothetical protein
VLLGSGAAIAAPFGGPHRRLDQPCGTGFYTSADGVTWMQVAQGAFTATTTDRPS